jgi:hypothetical protein
MGNRSRTLNAQMPCHAPKIAQLLTACKVYCEGLTPIPEGDIGQHAAGIGVGEVLLPALRFSNGTTMLLNHDISIR